MRKKLLSLSLIAFLVIMFASINRSTGEIVSWKIGYVDEGIPGGQRSIAFDPNDPNQWPHLVYQYSEGQTLSYAVATGSEWEKQYLSDLLPDPFIYTPRWGYGASIDLDSNGYPHISYQVRDHGYWASHNIEIWETTCSLWLAKYSDEGWTTDVAEQNNYEWLGYMSTLALDSNDLPHIASNSFIWDVTEWGSGTHDPLDAELDRRMVESIHKSSSREWIRRSSSDIKYYDWVHTPVSSIAVDSQDNIHVTYQAGDGIGYTKFIWTPDEYPYLDYDYYESYQPLGVPTGAQNSLALDSNDNPHISYYDYRSGELKYTYWTGNEWDGPHTLDFVGFDDALYPDTPGISCNSIALDSEDHPHISYYDITNQDLKYIFWSGTDWSPPLTIDEGVALYDTGSLNSIAVDSFDNVHIIYNSNHEHAEWLTYATTADNPPAPTERELSYLIWIGLIVVLIIVVGFGFYIWRRFRRHDIPRPVD